MYIYLTYKEVLRRIDGVTLDGFSVPRCGHVTKDHLDPSLWFKVLVLDSMLVDCDRQNVYWNRDVPPEKEDIHGYRESQLSVDLVRDFFRGKERIFDDQECQEYDANFDDLFDTAALAIKQLATESESTAACDHVFRILHIFILPKLTIKRVDRANVECLLSKLEAKHNEIEEEIKRALQSENTAKNSLNSQTKDFLKKDDSFSRASYVVSCDHEFLDIFLEHLDQYVIECRDGLNDYSEKITPIRQSEDTEDMKKLKLLRSQRDMLHEEFRRAMMVCEEIKRHRTKQHANHETVRQTSFDCQISYVKTFRCLQMSRMEVRKKITTKIAISAVREAMLFTLKELDNDETSYGYCCIKGSVDIESDIGELDQVPEEWTTLPSRVAALLQNPDEVFISKHVEFCESIKQKCHQLQNELKVKSVKGRNGLINDDGLGHSYTIRWSSGSICRESCESTCIQVNRHISELSEELCNVLVNVFTQNIRSLRNKVYMCYGERVLCELMSFLSAVYEESYRDLAQELTEWIASVPITTICGGENKLLNTLIQQSTAIYDGHQHVNQDEHIYDVPLEFKQQRSVVRGSGYESMKTIHEMIDNKPSAIPEVPECEMEIDNPAKDTEHKPNTETTDCKDQTGITMRRGLSQRKRHGISLTAEQADKIEAEMSTGNIANTDSAAGWFAEDGYVDMKFYPASAIRHLFSEFCDFDSLVRKEITASSMGAKLRAMTDIMRYIESRQRALKSKAGKDELVCADDLLDVLILLLCQLKPDELLKLYAQINLLTHLCPNFMTGNIHAYALTNLYAAYCHLFEQAKHRATMS